MKRIRKVSQSIPINAKVVNSYSESEEETYSCDYVNEHKQEKLIAGTGIEITGENIINNIQGNYSTEEVKIGTWIDGKPLYKKVISKRNIAVSNGVEIATEIDNVERIVDYNAVFLDTAAGTLRKYPLYSSDFTKFLIAEITNGGQKIIIKGTDSWSASGARYHMFTLLYTKTTD